MIFEHVYDDDLAQGSYLIGCQASGEAIVVDPRRDIQVYLEAAARRQLRIVAVAETHIHADYLSGSRELEAATGARLYLSGEGDDDWQYAFEGTRLRHGDEIGLGNVRLEAVHTPGHTPEHLSFLITDGATADEPGFVLTGDFVFVGDVGRPDLLDEAAGGVATRFAAALRLFSSLADGFLTLPDHVQVWPGHGAGSACGKSLGALASTTVGYERRVAWWVPYVERGDADGFVRALLDGQPDAPRYFGRMKRLNRSGPPVLGPLNALRHVAPEELARSVSAGDWLLVDVRPPEVAARSAVPGAIAIPAGGSFATYASYVLDPERDDRPIMLLGAGDALAEKVRRAAIRVGIDGVVGYAPDLTGVGGQSVPTVAPEELDRLERPFLLDVRTRSEFDAGHVPGAVQIHAGRVMWELDRIPTDRRVVAYCQTGARSSVVASALRATGVDVLELEGSFEAWRRSPATGTA